MISSQGVGALYARAITVSALAVAITLGSFLLAPRAYAAGARPPTTLWESFPLNPTGERLRTGSEAPGVLLPPVVPRVRAQAAVPSRGGSTPVLFALVAAATTFVVVLAAFSTSGLTQRRARRTERRPSAYFSAVFVRSRWLPVVEDVATVETRRISSGARAAVALAVALVVGLLVARYG